VAIFTGARCIGSASALSLARTVMAALLWRVAVFAQLSTPVKNSSCGGPPASECHSRAPLQAETTGRCIRSSL